MRRVSFVIAGALVLLGAALTAASGRQASDTFSHADAFEHYEGTRTCLQCHRAEATSFFHSQHYQWKGATPQLANAHGRRLGKINTINDFCTGPSVNWIGIVKNSRGEIVSKGCSRCHAGAGLRPTGQMTEAQLENIDCLICHASGYQRDLVAPAGGALAWKPILWKNQEGLDSVAKRLSRPTRTMCLRCHSASGGGPNYKRGDLEYILADPPRDHDVHMASDGANLQCVDCHAGSDHRVLGRGADLPATDSPGKKLSCEGTCHDAAPHKQPVLNRHAARVYCTSCHVPSFAREEPTDMVRDWSKASYNTEADRYTATISLQKDVTPVYAWFNGTSVATLANEPVRVDRTGRVVMMAPVGTRRDPSARIYPFKLHRGRMPVMTGRGWIIPMLVEEFFADGNIDAAVRNASREFYGITDPAYTWEDTVRYMGIFHGVPPAARAVPCLGCHSPGGRLDWKSLGYSEDPLTRRRAPSTSSGAR